MTTSSPLFDVDQLSSEHQKIFQTVYNELKPQHVAYVDFKLSLQLKTKLNIEEEENEWCYELHRYLRARKWNVPHTIKSVSEMIQWRKDNQIDSILEHEPTIRGVSLLRKIVPSVYHGYSKADRPIYIEKSGLMHVDKILHMFTPEELLRCHIYELEYSCQLARERSRQIGKHVETITMITDMNGCGMEIRKAFHLYRQALHVDENFYPERLGQMLVVNPPYIFPILWNIVKHWFDPVTREKINVMKKGSEAIATLLQHIDSDQLPKEYGGTCSSCPNAPQCVPVYDWSKDNVANEKATA